MNSSNMRQISENDECAIKLADTQEIAIGQLKIRPSLCAVEVASMRIQLEPRVMQVLVALAQANGGVVSRESLIAQCWGGRIVGEDAITRCISKIRRLQVDTGHNCFTIETIPRVGYRLIEDAGATRSRHNQTSQLEHRRLRRLRTILGMTLILLATSLIVIILR